MPDARRGRARHARGAGAGFALVVLLVLVYGVLLAGLAWRWPGAGGLAIVSLALNLGAFLAYWRDKHAARHGHWRARERSLHAWSLAGGWLGAGIAQRVLRHKTAKPGFLAVYRATVLLHLAAVALLVAWRLSR